MKIKNIKKGFTLIELIVVIAIIGILAAVLLPRFGGFTDKAREKSAISEAKAVYTTLETYYAEKGKYPADVSGKISEDELKTVVTSSKNLENVSDYNSKATGDGELFKYKKGTITVTCKANGTITKD